MPQIFRIDQAATFSAIAFLEATPKRIFGSSEQDRTADGLPKWDVQLIAGFRDQFGNNAHEVIKVGVASGRNPGEGLAPYTPVALVGFVVGVVPAEIRKNNRGEDRVTGGTTWYRADEVRPISAPTGQRQAAPTK
jgi:hypothetical protein